MHCTTCGNTLIAGNRFCTSCGAANPGASSPPTGALSGLAPPASTPAPVAAPPSAASAPPSSDVPAPPTTAATGGSGRRFGPRIVVAIVVVMVVAVVAFVVLQRGGDGDGYAGSDRDLVVLTSYDRDGDADESTVSRLGDDGQPVSLGDGAFDSADVLGTGRAVARSGGPVVGQVYEDDGAIVVSADPGSGEVVELLGESDGFDVSYDPDGDRVLVVESSGSDERCHAGPVSGPLERIGRGDTCFFGPDGRLVLIADFDDDGEVDFEVVSLDGSRVYEGSSARLPEFTRDGGHLVVFDGNDEQVAAVLVGLDDGLEITSAERGDDAAVLASDGSGRVLVATQADDEVVLELLDPVGTTTELLTNEGPVVGDFLDDTSGTVIAVTTDEDGAGLRTLAPAGDGADIVEERIADADEIDLRIAPAGLRAGRFVAIATEDDEDDAVVHVSTDAGVVEIDATEVGSTWISKSGDRLFMVAAEGSDDDFLEYGIVAVDLGDGTFEWIVEGWYDIAIADVRADGTGVVAVGFEESDDDEQVVVHVSADGTTEFVEEAEWFGRISYTADGGGLIVPVVGSFDDPDEIDTFEYRLGARSQPELLYSGQEISAAGWDDLDAPTPLFSANGIEAPLPTAGCVETLPGLEVVTAGDGASGFVDVAGAATYCLEVTEATRLVVRVVGFDGFDTTLGISGGNGLEFFNDDYDDLDPLIDEFFEAGAYEVTVRGFEGSSGSFDLFVDF